MRTATICHDLRCDHSGERPRYYARQIITADDMTLEQEYFRGKLRMHNRMLHGWGIVCGADVSPVEKAGNPMEDEPWQVLIEPGYILGPYGDEIVIDCERKFDLRSQSIIGVTGEPCVEEIDPWCVEVHEDRGSGAFYIAVRYKEVMMRPVRAHPAGCNCDDTSCEYSRLRDGYEIKVLRSCPSSHTALASSGSCPPCPEEPWVVLKKVEVDAEGDVTVSDECRRMLQPSIILRPRPPRPVKGRAEPAIILPPEVDVPEEPRREVKEIHPPSKPSAMKKPRKKGR
jgi:hypothetical protein